MQRGAALFRGETTLPGRLVGHSLALPTLATRCVNCHEADRGAPVAGGVPATYALALDRASLAGSRSRRGGPPSRYDAASLCTLLRSGVDPAHVMIPTTMPRYDITEPQCADLWAHLLTR